MRFLTPTELEQLTGRIQRAAQVRQLQRRGIRHQLDANGAPVVTWAAVEGRPEEDEKKSRPPINWDVVA